MDINAMRNYPNLAEKWKKQNAALHTEKRNNPQARTSS
jgi:hypothetical protein